jgi:hypothetical protein
MTRDVKEAIIAACNQIGSDGKGTGGLQGYMVFLGKHHPIRQGQRDADHHDALARG